jgi:hypothetical protein
MSIEQITDYSVNLVLLQEQYKKSNKLIGIIEADNDQADDLEKALFEIRDEFYLSTAVGVQLDVVGNIFNVNREGMNDNDYREAIESRSTLVGSGEPEFVIKTLLSIYGATYVNYIPAYPTVPAAYYLQTDATMDIESLRTISPSGVEPAFYGYLIYQTGDFILDYDGNKIFIANAESP